jgi:hypothetical protein
METQSINCCMDKKKKPVVYPYNAEQYHPLKRNEALRCDPQNITLSERSQTQRANII